MNEATVTLNPNQEKQRLLEALQEIETHIRSTSKPTYYILETLKEALPEKNKEPVAEIELDEEGKTFLAALWKIQSHINSNSKSLFLIIQVLKETLPEWQ